MSDSIEHLSIFNSSSVNQIHGEMERLDNLFRNVYKRAPEVEMFISTQWKNDRASYSIALYFQSRHREDAEYLMSQTNNNQKDS